MLFIWPRQLLYNLDDYNIPFYFEEHDVFLCGLDVLFEGLTYACQQNSWGITCHNFEGQAFDALQCFNFLDFSGV